MLGMLNNEILALMTSIGQRTGLFDTMSTLPPSISAQIAAATGLHKRYGHEWLGAMVTAGVVDVDPASTRTVLPAEWCIDDPPESRFPLHRNASTSARHSASLVYGQEVRTGITRIRLQVLPR